MDEFEKIKTFSESLAERQQNISDKQPTQGGNELDLPTYLSQFRAVPVQEEKDSKHLLWIVLVLCMLIVIGVIYALSQRFSNMEENEIVVISPTPTPVKVLPENPGGLNIPDKDKVVFNRANEETQQVVVENLFPEPEQPVLPAEVINPEDKEVEELAPVPQEAPAEEVVIEKQEEVIVEEEPTPVVVEEIKEIVQEGEVAVPEKEEIKPEPEKIEEIAPVKEEKKVENKVVWRAQLLSSASKAKVESSWKQISQKQKALLSDMPYQIISATIPGKGTFWRLQVGEFATKEMVVNLCAKLKKKKQECIPVK